MSSTSIASLNQLLEEVRELPPSKKNAKLVSFALPRLQDGYASLQGELDPKLLAFDIVPKDYALILRVSKSLPWAFEVLKNSPHVSIITTAVDVVAKLWRADPQSVKDTFGGETSEHLIQLINADLPRYATVRLFKLFGRTPKLTITHTNTVDNVLRAIFPFLSPNSPTPLARYARSAATILFIAGSAPLVTAIVQRCSSWFEGSTWNELAERRPDLVEALLLRQLDSSLPDAESVVKSWVYNRDMLNALIRKQKDRTFFERFLQGYVDRVLTQKDSHDLLNASNLDRMAVLAEYAGFILRKRTQPKEVCLVGAAFCNLLGLLVTAGESKKWETSWIMPILEIAVEEYARQPTLWTLELSMDNDASPSAITFLVAIWNHHDYSAVTFNNPSSGLLTLLQRLPLPARLPFINSLYLTATGESLVETPKTPELYPTISATLLSLLGPDHGRRILEVGMKARESKFVGPPVNQRQGTGRVYALSHLWDAEASSQLLLAIWAGKDRSVFGKRASEAGEADDESIRDVEIYKQKAMRSRDDRFRLITTALSLALLSRSPGLFTDTLSWAVKRYAKDVETGPQLLVWLADSDKSLVNEFLSGPVGLYVSDRTQRQLTVDTFTQWALKTNEVFDSLMHLLNIWVNEPGHGTIETQHSNVGDLLRTVIRGRSNLIEKIYPVMLSDAESIRNALLTPLLVHWDSWERFKVQKHPDLLGFNSILNTPSSLYPGIGISAYALPVIAPFLDSLVKLREGIYGEERRRIVYVDDLDVEHRKREQSDYRRQILPFDLQVSDDRKPSTELSCQGVNLPAYIHSYAKSILLADPSTKPEDMEDRYDWDVTQFREALQTYLEFSIDMAEVDYKVLDLLKRYKTPYHGDLRVPILRSEKVRTLLWTREALVGEVAHWLPELPGQQNAENMDINPLSLMPPKKLDNGKLVVALRDFDHEDKQEPMLKLLLAPFSRSMAPRTLRIASINIIRRIAIFASAWIFTVMKIPRPENPSDISGPIHYALRHVRVSQEFLSLFEKSRISGPKELGWAKYPCRILALILPSLSPNEVELLIDAVFSAASTPINQAIQMTVLKALRGLGNPELGSEQAWQVVKDVEASSWHRQTITSGFIDLCRPLKACSTVEELLKYTQNQYHQQKESNRAKTRTGEKDAGEEVPLLKMSTHKMAMQLLQKVFQQGSVGAPFVEESAKAGLLVTPTAIQSYVVDILVEIVEDSVDLSRHTAEDSDIWNVLKPYVQAAIRLSEDVPVLTEQWEAARSKKGPMPDIIHERPIAASLLSRHKYTSSFSLQKAWARNIVEPIILGHVEVRTKWLKTAIAREGGSAKLQDSISAIYQSSIPVTSNFTYSAPYFPPAVSSILRILEQKALGFLYRQPCQELRSLMDANYPVGWQREKYGANVLNLTAYAISDDLSTGSSDLTAIRTVLTDSNTPATVAEATSSSLQRIGSVLLEPGNMLIHNDRKALVPFGAFNYLITQHLAPPSSDSYEAKIISLLSRFLTVAQGHEQQLAQKTLHGGACYWRTILTLELLLLRVRSETTTHNSDSWVQDRASNLASIVKRVAEAGWGGVNFPHAFGSFLRIPRVEDVIPLAIALTQPPICPNDPVPERLIYFETAVAILRAHLAQITASATATRQLKELHEWWGSDADGLVKWLVLSWHDQAANI